MSRVAALLRTIAVTMLVALLLDAPIGRSRRPTPLVALDASASWRRSGHAWTAALDSVRRLRPDSLMLFGDSARVGPIPRDTQEPADRGSRVGDAVERAVAAGRSLVVVTDGELDDPTRLDDLPPGSRVVVVPRPARRDAALVTLELPRSVASGDSVDVQMAIAAGAKGAGAGLIVLDQNDRLLTRIPITALAAWGERSLTTRIPLVGADGPSLLRAVVTTAGDTEPRNDTLVAVVELSRAAGAAFVSARPDVDAREALSVLRSALSVPARAYWQVAPGQWRVDGTMAPVGESEVRRVLREAPVAVLHGDTAVFGPPRATTRGALALVAPSAEEEGEWYVRGAPPSPLASALSGLPWDSLPPVHVGPAPVADWRALEARLGRTGAPRAGIAGYDTPRRVVVVTLSGLWRWRLRAGAAGDAFTALWGAVFDWLLAGRRDSRAVVPDAVAVREGDVVRWRRGLTNDSTVSITLTRRSRGDAPVWSDSMTLRFTSDDNVAVTAPLAAGVYDVRSPSGASLLAVNAAREWLPRRATVRARSVDGVPPAERSPGLRRSGWPYAIVIAALCAEWILRRRRGLR